MGSRLLSFMLLALLTTTAQAEVRTITATGEYRPRVEGVTARTTAWRAWHVARNFLVHQGAAHS